MNALSHLLWYLHGNGSIETFHSSLTIQRADHFSSRFFFWFHFMNLVAYNSRERSCLPLQYFMILIYITIENKSIPNLFFVQWALKSEHVDLAFACLFLSHTSSPTLHSLPLSLAFDMHYFQYQTEYRCDDDPVASNSCQFIDNDFITNVRCSSFENDRKYTFHIIL